MNWKTWGMFARDHAPEGKVVFYKGLGSCSPILDILSFLTISVNSQHTAENSTTVMFSFFTQTAFFALITPSTLFLK